MSRPLTRAGTSSSHRTLESSLSKYCSTNSITSLAQEKDGLHDLPPEIWIHILRLATKVPYFLFEDIMEMPSIQRHMPFKTDYLEKSLATKGRVVLVCKAWHVWGLPYLYEGLVVRIPSISSIIHVLKTRDERGDAKGHLVKRLDLLPFALRSPLQLSQHCAEWESVPSLIECLPNLQMFANIWSTPPSPTATRILRTLATTCGPTLEVLATHNQPRVADFTGLLLATPNLRVSHCVCNPFDIFNASEATWFTVPNPDSQILQSKLTTANYNHAVLRPQNFFLAQTFAASPLQRVTIDLGLTHARDVLITHGSRLTSVEIICFGDESLADVFELIRAHCPKIKELFVAETTFSQNLEIPASMEVLTLNPWLASGESQEDTWRKFRDSFLTMRVAGLKEVLILIDKLWDEVFRAHLEELQGLTEFFASRMIAFRSSNGQLISSLYGSHI